MNWTEILAWSVATFLGLLSITLLLVIAHQNSVLNSIMADLFPDDEESQMAMTRTYTVGDEDSD